MPRGVDHTFSNEATKQARLLVVVTPSAHRLVEELGRLGASGRIDSTEMAAAFARYDSEITEPA